MDTCQQCGAALPDGATFCPSCGGRVHTASPTGAADTAQRPRDDLGTRPATPSGASPSAMSLTPATSAMSDSEVRAWAMAAHLTALAGGFVGGLASFVGPLVVWLIKRDDDPFVAEHARESLNFNLLVFALVAIGFVLVLFTLGIGLLAVGPLALLLGVFWLVVTIQATMAASRGERYRYPLSVRWIR